MRRRPHHRRTVSSRRRPTASRRTWSGASLRVSLAAIRIAAIAAVSHRPVWRQSDGIASRAACRSASTLAPESREFSTVLQSNRSMSSVTPLRLAFLGCGFITRVHSGHLRSLGGVVIPHYASRDRTKADAYCRRYNGGGSYAAYAAAID